DAAYYHDVALSLRGLGPRLEGEIAFANIGYPHVLGVLYALRPSPTLALMVQALLGAVTALLTGLVAREAFGRERVGLWAAGLYALYAPSIFYDGLLLVPSLSAFTLALLAWSLQRALRVRSWPLALVSGLSIATAALLRSSQLLLLPFALLIVARSAVIPARARLRLGSALLLGTLLCVGPVIARQRVDSGYWLPLTSNGGMNFWIGNHPDASGSYTPAPFLGPARGGDYRHTLIVERDHFLAEAERRSGKAPLSLAEADRFWWAEGLRFITASPGKWLRVWLVKCRLVFSDHELGNNASFDLLAEVSPVLRWDPVRFGVLLLLAVFGACELQRARQRRAAVLLALLLAAPLLTCVVFFVSGEYRHAAAPALAVLAAFGLGRVRGFVAAAGQRLRTAWPRYLAPLAALVLVCAQTRRQGAAQSRKAYAEALAMPSVSGGVPSLERYGRARQLLSQHGDSAEDRLLSAEASLLVESNQAIQFQDRAAAERLIRVSRGLWQEQLRPGAPFDWATIDRIRRNSVRRVAQLCRQPFVRQWPEVESELTLLGCHSWPEGGFGSAELVTDPVRDLLERGPPSQAIFRLKAAVRDGPYDEAAHYALGNLMLAHESPEAVLEFFSKEAERDAKPQTSHYFMALAFEKMARDDDCLRELHRALELDPAHELSQRRWGLLLERRGELQSALEHLVEAIRIHPEYRPALEDAARLADRLGRHAEADEWLGRAREANSDSPRRFLYWARYLHEHGRDAAALSEVERRLSEAPLDTEALALERVIVAGLAEKSGAGQK
ncbi:MAG TPA: hypothetical protein VFK05_33825, partial [Polyangiaceae bacterium]|nr:hypothetical protein [Polyangiaceae bacterium]